MDKDTKRPRAAAAPTPRLTQADYYERWLGQTVRCVFQDGKALQGVLVSWDPYALILEQGGRPIIVHKGALKYTLPADEGGPGSGSPSV